jgi:FixJ family two-component response regulator/AraC-like DNA-binding protein
VFSGQIRNDVAPASEVRREPPLSAGRTPVPGHPGADTSQPALLWIDDEISRESGGVQLLEREGFRVHCSVTGAAGLAMARSGNYQGILLDLRLPDIPGLAVLATLRAESISTPVLVLTGFGDTDSAFAACHFGANGFRSKPLFGDDLPRAVEQLLQHALPQTVCAERGEDVLAAKVRAQYSSIAALLEGLHRLSRNHRVAAGSTPVDIRKTVQAALVRALTSSDLPMPVFLACATALKRTMDAEAAVGSWRDTVADAEEIILEALGRQTPSDSRVVAVLNMLEVAAAQRKRLAAKDIAKTQNVDASHLSRLVKSETGFEFTDWRTALLLRPGLRALTETKEHVKQIACHLLHFSDETQFTHEFGRTFGLSPTEFRQTWQRRGK